MYTIIFVELKSCLESFGCFIKWKDEKVYEKQKFRTVHNIDARTYVRMFINCFTTILARISFNNIMDVLNQNSHLIISLLINQCYFK